LGFVGRVEGMKGMEGVEGLVWPKKDYKKNLSQINTKFYMISGTI